MNVDSVTNLGNSQSSDYGTPYKVCYPNGQVEKKGFSLNGSLNGPHVCYYHDGQLEEKCVFKNGELDGPYVSYYSNGQLEKRCVFRRGALNGQYEEYDRRGRLVSKGFYHNDRFMSDEEMCARQQANVRLQQLNETMPPIEARRLAKHKETADFRVLYPRSLER